MEQWSRTKSRVADGIDAGNWQFWIDWYDALLKGRTIVPDPILSWAILEKIALIDPRTWDAGPETVNPLIRDIWKLVP